MTPKAGMDFEWQESMGYPKKHRGRRKIGSKRRRMRRKRRKGQRLRKK
jgi:hypothetical protein